MKMKVYIVKVLKDLPTSYDGLDDVNVKIVCSYEKALNLLKKAYDSSVEYFKNMSDIYEPEEDYYSEEEALFKVNDGGHYLSGNITHYELELDKSILTKDMKLNDITLPVTDWVECKDKIVEDYFKNGADSMWEELAGTQLVGFTIEEVLIIASGCHEKADSEVIVRVERDTVDNLVEQGVYIYEY